MRNTYTPQVTVPEESLYRRLGRAVCEFEAERQAKKASGSKKSSNLYNSVPNLSVLYSNLQEMEASDPGFSSNEFDE